MDWLVTSILLSVVLTVVLNVVLRAFPRLGDSAARGLDRMLAPPAGERRRVRVWFPWKAMLVASIALTVALNVALWLL